MAQDKLYFLNGTIETGIVSSVAKNVVYFKKTDTSIVRQINKADLILIEKYDGTRYFFSKRVNDETGSNAKIVNLNIKRNILEVQPFSVFLGRATLIYERLSSNGKIGFSLPLSLTFDPVGIIYKPQTDTLRRPIPRNSGFGFVGGADVNFYLGKNENAQFFIGPRLRFGNNLFVENIEAYTLQTQVGWRFGKPENTFVQHLSLGFGFVRILSSSFRRVNPSQSYAWYSFSYRLGIKW